MRRRELLAAVGGGSLAAVAGSALAPRVALATEGQPDSEAGRALDEFRHTTSQATRQ